MVRSFLSVCIYIYYTYLLYIRMSGVHSLTVGNFMALIPLKSSGFHVKLWSCHIWRSERRKQI